MIRFLFKNLFLKLKGFMMYEISLLSLFSNLIGINALTKEVSKSNIIYCKDFIKYDDGYLVYTINNMVSIPFEGIVSKKGDGFIRIDIGSNIIFTLSKIDSKLYLYERISPDTIIANSSSYYISANQTNLSYLDFKVIYETV